MTDWTIRRVIEWTAADFRERGMASPRLDAELLLADALQTSRIQLYLDIDRPLNEDELRQMRSRVERRRLYEPIAYLLGRREFYGRTFEVNPSVLIPRPETEVLIERVLETLPPSREAIVLDIGTGSGAIAITLAVERPSLRVHATDISSSAMEVARRNALEHKVSDRIDWFETDLFAREKDLRYDIIVSNPPYIAEGQIETLQPDIAKHEPRMALNGGSDGLDFYRRIAADSASFLKKRAAVFLEVGLGQADEVARLFTAALPDGRVQIHKDLAGIERVVEIVRNT